MLSCSRAPLTYGRPVPKVVWGRLESEDIFGLDDTRSQQGQLVGIARGEGQVRNCLGIEQRGNLSRSGLQQGRRGADFDGFTDFTDAQMKVHVRYLVDRQAENVMDLRGKAGCFDLDADVSGRNLRQVVDAGVIGFRNSGRWCRGQRHSR